MANERYDNKGNLVRWSDKVGKWVVVKSAAQVSREKLAAARKKTGDAISKISDTTRGGMAKNREKVAAKKKPFNKNENAAKKPVASAPKPPVKPPAAPKSDKPSYTGSASSASAGTRKITSPAKPMKTVDQSRTEWVAKGTKLSDGTIVQKGYLAQKGKPEKKVTANVKIQTDTASGKKAGQTYSYNKGKSGSQVKKK